MAVHENPFLTEIGPVVESVFGESCSLVSEKYDRHSFGNAVAKFQFGQIVFELVRDRGDVFLDIGSVNSKDMHEAATIKSYLGRLPRKSRDIKNELEFLKKFSGDIESIFKINDIDETLSNISISHSDRLIAKIARKAKRKST